MKVTLTAVLLAFCFVSHAQAEDRVQNAIRYCDEIRSVIIISAEMKYDRKTPQDAFAIQQMRDLTDVPDLKKKYLINQIYFNPGLSNLNPYTANVFGSQVYMECMQESSRPQTHYTPLR